MQALMLQAEPHKSDSELYIAALRSPETHRNFDHVPFACEGNMKIEAHRVILSAKSPIFKFSDHDQEIKFPVSGSIR